jgi:hypothetical protein
MQIKVVVAEMFGPRPPDPPRHPWDNTWTPGPEKAWNGSGQWELPTQDRTIWSDITAADATWWFTNGGGDKVRSGEN